MDGYYQPYQRAPYNAMYTQPPPPPQAAAYVPGTNTTTIEYMHKSRWWGNFSAGLAFFCFLAVIGVAVLGAVALTNARYKDRIASVTTSGELPSTPYKIRLDGIAALAMTLPNDLSKYVGATYVISAGTANTHTLTIQPGTLSTTFDGSNTIATWGGAVGDLIQIEVIGKDRIVVTSNVNVAFS